MALVLSAGKTVSSGRLSIPVADPGQSLIGYSGASTDPMRLWKSQPSLRKVVDFAASQAASIPWHAFERVSDTDRRRAAGSPAERILGAPSRFKTGFNFWRTVYIDRMIYDRFLVVFDGQELIRIPPRLMRVTSDALSRVTGIYIRTSDRDIDITDAPMATSWGWSPMGEGGISPMYTLSQILEEGRRAVEWRNAQWTNAAKVSGFLKRPADKDWKEGARDRFIEDWKKWKDSHAGGTPILEDGMEYEAVEGIRPIDARDIEGRQLTDAEVASAFHIQPELVGARPGNFSNIGAWRQMLFGPTLGPMFQDVQQAINQGLVPHFDGATDLYVEANRQAAIDGSLIEQAQLLSTSTGGPWMSRNEARARMNLQAKAGGDELITPLNVVTGGLASPRDTGSQNKKTLTPSPRMVLKNARPAGLGTTEEQQQQLAAAITKVLGQQQRDLAAGSFTAAGFHRQWDDVMAQAVQNELWNPALAGAWKVLDEFNPDAEGWAPEVMAGYLEAMAATTATGINIGVINALTEVETDRADAFEKLRNAGAAAWGVSLATQAAGFGAVDAAKATGLRTKTWLVQSRNPRTSHAAMSGATVPIDQRFSNGAKWPGDPILGADETAGCTCGVAFSV